MNALKVDNDGLASSANQTTADLLLQQQQKFLNENEPNLNLINENEEADLSNEWVKEFQSMSNLNNSNNDQQQEQHQHHSLVDETSASSFWSDLQDEWNIAAA